MADYMDSLQVMFKKITDLFKASEEAENNDPFTYNVIDAFEAFFEKASTSMEKYAKENQNAYAIYTESFHTINEEYAKEEKILEDKLTKTEDAIRRKYQEKADKLDEDIRIKDQELDFEERNRLQDVEFFKIASEQNKELFRSEYEENITRFNYQIQVAKESYADNTIHYNDILTQDLEVLKNNFSAVVNGYDSETQTIIEKYSQKKIEITKELNARNETIENLQESGRAIKRKDSMELNEKIRGLMDKRNALIQDARSTYNQQLAASNEEREQKRQQYQLDTQKINKDYVMSMNALDEKQAKAKEKMDNAISDENHELQYRLFDLKNEEEKELLELYKDPSYSKPQAKRIKMSFYRAAEIEKKNTTRAIRALSRNYQTEVENISYQRKLAEIDRSYNVKSIVEQDANTTKVYQQISGEYESEMNQKIDNANLDFNRGAHLLRTKNTLSSLAGERAFDESDANFEKEIEDYSTKIKDMDCEIQSFQEIRNLIHKYEENKYAVTKKFKTVYTVLEIEKCKVLDILNHSMYDLNRKSSKMVLDTSCETEDLKNQEYEIGARNIVDRNKLVFEDEKKLVEYQKQCFRTDMNTELLTLRRNYYFELDTLGHHFLSRKFRLEYRLLNQGISTISKINDAVMKMNVDIINYIFNTITPRPEQFKNIKSFLRSYLLLSLETISRIAECFRTQVNLMIDERFSFESSIQYKGYYKNLESEYTEDVREVEDQKKKIISEIDRNTQAYENNQNILFSMDNDLQNKRHKLKTGEVPAIILNEEIAKLLHDAEILHQDNQKYTRTISSLSRDLKQLDLKLQAINQSYSRSQDEIRKMQETGASSYTEFKKELGHILDSSLAGIRQDYRIPDEATDITIYAESIKEIHAQFLQNMVLLLKNIYQASFRFEAREKDSIVKATRILDSGYKADLMEIEADAKELSEKNAQIFQKEESIRQHGITEYDRMAKARVEDIHQKMALHETKIKEETDNIQMEMKAANQNFYDDYYAICDNQKDMVSKQKQDMSILTIEHERNRNQVISRFQKNKEDLNQALEEYIFNKNELINRLPEAQRNQEKTINEQARIQNEKMDQEYTDIKVKYELERKEIRKNKGNIEQGFRTNLETLLKESKNSRQKEKKLHLKQLKRISAK